mgnify:FL=1
MKEIRAIVDAYSTIDFTKNQASLATVVRVEGSSYRRMGARMLVKDDGNYLGGISGGCLEGDALRRAQKAIASQKPSMITYDTTQDDGHKVGVGLGCNGIIDVLFTPLGNDEPGNPLDILSGLVDTRMPRIMVSITGPNNNQHMLGRSWIYENEDQFRGAFAMPEILGDLLKDIVLAKESLSSKSVLYQTEEGQTQVFIEVVLPALQLVLYGANYDLYPMARISRELGWNVTVVTNIARAGKSLFALADKVVHNKGDELPQIDGFTAILLMSHDYKTDFSNLQKSIHTNAGYIGLLGPRKRALKMFDAMIADGRPLTKKDQHRIFAPAGLHIGAASPEEIALSIIAEIQAHFAGGTGTPLRLKKGAIHSD